MPPGLVEAGARVFFLPILELVARSPGVVLLLDHLPLAAVFSHFPEQQLVLFAATLARCVIPASRPCETAVIAGASAPLREPILCVQVAGRGCIAIA